MARIIWHTGADGAPEPVTGEWQAFTGLPKTADWLDGVHPEDRELAASAWEQALADQSAYEAEYRLRRADGVYRWMLDRGAPVREESGAVVGWIGVCEDVAEQREAVQAVTRAEQRLRLAMEAAAMGSFVWDRRADTLHWNDRGFRLLGFPPVEGRIPAAYCFRRVHREDRPGLRLALEGSLEPGCELKHQFRVLRADGCERWLACRGQVLRDPSPGAVAHLFGVIFDITEHRLAVETIRAQESELRQSAAQLHARLTRQRAVAELGMFAFNCGDTQSLLSRVVQVVGEVLDCELTKVLELLPEGNLILRTGVGWREGLVGSAVVPGGSGSQAGYTLATSEPVVVRCLETEQRFSGPALLREHAVRSGISVVIAGARGPFGVLGAHTAHPRTFDEDDIQFMQCVANVVAEYVERRRLEARSDLLVQSVEDYGLLLLDQSGRITTWNRGAEAITGWRAAEMIGRSIVDFYPEAERTTGRLEAELQKCATAGRLPQEGWRLRKDGTLFLAACVTFPLNDASGRLLGFSRVVRDITDQRREEAALRSIMGFSVDAYVTIDDRGTIQSCGGAYERVLGYAEGELVGRNVRMLMDEPDRSRHDSYLARYRDTGEARIVGKSREVVGLRKDGSKVPLDLAITEFRLNGGRYFTGILRDITERKRMEEQVRHSERMRALGRLAGGIAHDFNNILTVINGYCELALTRPALAESLRRIFQEVHSAGQRGAGLTRQLLAFSRKQVMAPRVLSLNRTVADTERMLRRLIGEDVELVTDCPRDLRLVRVDPGQMEQVVLNLAVNARAAMPDGGRLLIETRNFDVPPEGSSQFPGAAPGGYVLLRVSDSGCGIPLEIQDRIFEPFFTTRGQGAGTGLGLATVHGIVIQSAGHIRLESSPGAGTTFEILLPSTDEPLAPVSRPPLMLRGGDETVLLVEDDQAVRSIARKSLESGGYQVLEAASAEEALEVAAGRAGGVDLLLTDVILPGASGCQLAEELRKSIPGLRVLLMSGYIDDQRLRQAIRQAGDGFMQKPFSLPDLSRSVRETLDGT